MGVLIQMNVYFQVSNMELGDFVYMTIISAVNQYIENRRFAMYKMTISMGNNTDYYQHKREVRETDNRLRLKNNAKYQSQKQKERDTALIEFVSTFNK